MDMIERARVRRQVVRREWRHVNRWLGYGDATTTTTPNDDDDNHALPLVWTDHLDSHACLNSFARCTPSSLCSPLTLAEWQWASATVGTRSCFLPKVGFSSKSTIADQNENSNSSSASSSSSSSSSSSPTRNTSCLIPFLDMLNHSAQVEVECRLTESSYQLYMVQPSPLQLHTGEELFISYGAHSNTVLLERYGFTLLNNPHECIEFTLRHIETFLTSRQELLTPEQYTAITSPWPQPPEDDHTLADSNASPAAFNFYTCACDRHLDLTTTKLPRYARPLPGFEKKLQMWQIELMKACGLYDVLNQLESFTSNVSSSSKPITFTIRSCTLPFNLLTYIRIRVLTSNDLQEYAKLHSSVSNSIRGTAPSSILPASTIQSVASKLLDEDDPFLSPSHQLLTHRVIVELLTSHLIDPIRLGSSTVQADLKRWHQRTMLKLSYVQQQALILALTQKRLAHSVIAHSLAPV